MRDAISPFYVSCRDLYPKYPKNLTAVNSILGMKSFYLFNSRILTHVSFWVVYYISFSLIWAKPEGYFESFYLEFILLPVRMLAVYTTIYVLIPRYLRIEKYLNFILSLFGTLILAGLLQRVFIFFFYEALLEQEVTRFFDLGQLVRAMILINSTVLFVSTVKILQLWQLERNKNLQLIQELEGREEIVKIKSDKRVFRVKPNDIMFIEGLGNYVVYHTLDQKLISYISLKDALDRLPPYFLRIHKSYVINKQRVQSYDPESVEINQKMIPVGKSFKGELTI